MNKLTVISGMTALLLLIGSVIWYGGAGNKETDDVARQQKQVSRDTAGAAQGEIISQQAIHWHPELSITIKSEKQPIPANIGIGMQYAGYPQYDSMMMMTNIHTHDISGTIHWEVMEGPVRADDIKLGQFFSVWGKKFTSSCIFDTCNGPEGRITLKINGKENPDFENYLVKDRDKIEIVFE